jgi:ABC-type Mn2+/Zn2+ transport system ATPase subunit
MLRVENLSYGPPSLPPLQERLSFSLRPGELLHVVGPNGAGKSLLARVLLGLLPIRAGSVENAFTGIRYLPQMQNKAAHLPFSLGDVLRPEHPRAEDWAAIGLLESGKFALSWNKASGGERQRTLLTRLFLQPGNLLIVDEPFNHLDSGSKTKVQALLRRTIQEQPNTSILLVSHDDDPSQWMPGVPMVKLELREKP